MRRVNISTLKNNLSAILDTLEAQGPVIVTDRNKPVAELRRVEPSKVTEQERVADLEKRGILMPPRTSRSPLDILKKPLPKVPGLLDALLAERREGR